MGFEALLSVEILKKCPPLWCEAHVEVKMLKTYTILGALLDVQLSKSARPFGAKHIWMAKVKKQKRMVSEHFLRLGCGFVWKSPWILQDAFRVAVAIHESTRDISVRHVRTSGRCFFGESDLQVC